MLRSSVPFSQRMDSRKPGERRNLSIVLQKTKFLECHQHVMFARKRNSLGHAQQANIVALVSLMTKQSPSRNAKVLPRPSCSALPGRRWELKLRHGMCYASAFYSRWGGEP